MNAIVRASMESHHPMSIGYYDAGALQRAMRAALSKQRSLIKGIRPTAIIIDDPINCDVRPDGRRVEL